MKKVQRMMSVTRLRIIMTIIVMASSVLPIGRSASAQDTGSIEFLNPSSFASVPETGIVVSDKVPENPDGGDETYRLSAWVSGVPPNPAVEFELMTRQGVSLEVMDDVERVGTDTFEADWDIPDTLPDGPYMLRATLASGVLGIDNADQPIIIQRLADRAEITYPDNRSGSGQYGMYVPLASATDTDGAAVAPNPIGNIDARNTGSAPGSGTARVRAFYTVSQPGTKPEWKACGTEAAGGATFPSSAADNGVRCTLSSIDELTVVSAVAVLANNTKEGYQAALNQSGDATRVVEPYSQIPSSLSVVVGATGTVDSGSCHLVNVELTDQFQREIAGANLDVHAWGPNDRLRFGTGPIDEWGSVPPDKGSHATEEGIHCFAPEDDQSVGPQAEHQVIGGPDVKHVENEASGTSDTGQWGFELYAPAGSSTPDRHTTYWEVWLDETNTGTGANNDIYDVNELCRSGLIGWDAAASREAMPGAIPSCSETPPDPCDSTTTQQPQPCPTSPSPTPTTSPTPTPTPSSPPAEDDSISLKVDRRRVAGARMVRFSGVIDASAECSAEREVVLRSRRPGKQFRSRLETSSDVQGRWELRRRVRRTTEWSVVAPAARGCDEISSRTVKVKVTRG